MSHVVVTGAQGFVGRALVKRLLADGLGARAVSTLTLLDIAFDAPHADARVTQLAGSIADASVRAQAYAAPVDAVFHLASIPGGAAERDYALGRTINLDATLGLLEDLRGQARPPRFVFASTVAVYGEQLPEVVDERTLPAPALSYGAHKLTGEALVADATRLGWVQGCSLRLPGVVARPGDGAGMMSAFMSQLFWKLAANEAITVPVSPEGVAWWISVGACVDNLLHAATVDAERFNARRSYQMPVLRLTIAEVVDALAARFGESRKALVTYAPDPFIERLFAAYPPLLTPEAEQLGLRHDGTVEQLIARAIAH
ncbi:NAD-dependent epimerase/dehydratase family protein [Paraburkholderia tropica]|uniref:Nucleoside-diphosphate-sugar epimerase n=1 Tax=Paraburkholderia tropica TaxID=92647 RepID=A0ABX5MRR1_9BURK|nr:NAD-dependent epimerase/dehydratase family protein [Paraburkholderia tropica]MDE1143858.1 NAD-dependent epimerase/dehydratase family protein [Paraburkholderia tropica]PXX17073.1 nucleoside-diphosphate-sugar epimerase [Paraburkholderia tropica]PZW83784.1 nucleoside-diphosphate-sugar epimerase [Paraburkholderia tropica]QNB15698.1 NAD-dependent epimerase/dehydratase family protein [Paraburkholderia tropica]